MHHFTEYLLNISDKKTQINCSSLQILFSIFLGCITCQQRTFVYNTQTVSVMDYFQEKKIGQYLTNTYFSLVVEISDKALNLHKY